MELTCKVKRIRVATDKDLMSALKIYQKQMNISIKTDENQIFSYLSNRFQSNREMAFYALLCNDVVIGYAEIGIFLQSKVFFIDYFVLDSEYQNNAYFYMCYNLVVEDLLQEKKYASFKYIIIENYSGDNSNEVFIRKCLSLENYRVADVQYIQPGLDCQYNDSVVSCTLLIKETSKTSELENISRDLFLSILRDIYYSHYCEWYSHFFNEEEYKKYKNTVDEQFNKIEHSLSERIVTKNYTYINCKYFNSYKCDFTQNSQFNIPRKTNILVLIILSIITLVISVGVSFGLLYLFTYLNVPVQAIPSITAISSTFLTAAGIVIAIKSSRK